MTNVDSCWIVTKKDIYNLSGKEQLKLKNHVNTMLLSCFPNNYPGGLPDGYTFYFFIKGSFTEFNDLIENIKGFCYTRVDDKDTISIWNVCKNLSVSGKYMRNLFDIVKEHALSKGFKKIILYVDIKNLFFLKAVALYVSKGFVYDPKQQERSPEFTIRLICNLPNKTDLNKVDTSKMVNKTLAKMRKNQPILFDMFKIKNTAQKICSGKDVEYVLTLPYSVKQMIMKMDMKMDNHLFSFYKKLLQYNQSPNYDFFNMIDCPLHLIKSGDIVTEYKQLRLETTKNAVNSSIDLWHKGDKKKIDFYSVCTNFLDQFKHYMKAEQRLGRQTANFTNAWLKCWEMVHFYHLIPLDHSDDFTVFCNAEFPGAFIFAINQYIKTKTRNKNYKWFANSLWPGKCEIKGDKSLREEDSILGDSFGLYKKYRDHWLMNSGDETGDVTNPHMIGVMREKLGGKVDLYTSDIGIPLSYDDAKNQESLEAHLNLGQVVCALRTLKEGGSMVCKTFMFFKPMTMSLLYLLTSVFEYFTISKPMTSRPANAEIYLVGKGYHQDESVTSKLEELLFNWDIRKMNDWIVPIPRDFYLEIVYSLYYIYQRQTYFVDKNLEFVKHEYSLSTKPPKITDIFARKGTDDKNYKEFSLRQQMVEEWKRKYPITKIKEEDKL
jgi:hypothetical protein